MEWFADISLAAWMSLLALAIIVIISCINENLNVGFLSIALAIIVGGIWVNLSAVKVLNAFPLNLFMILVGVTFLFGLASTNGTMEKVAAYSLRACRGQAAWLPLIVYLLVTFLTTIGPGNIAATALVAPIAMAIAARVGISAFLMTLLVVGASNGAAFSPFAPTGIVSNGLIAKMAPQLPAILEHWSLDQLAWKIHFNSTYCQGIINIGGFLIMGGWSWIRSKRNQTLNIDELAPRPAPLHSQAMVHPDRYRPIDPAGHPSGPPLSERPLPPPPPEHHGQRGLRRIHPGGHPHDPWRRGQQSRRTSDALVGYHACLRGDGPDRCHGPGGGAERHGQDDRRHLRSGDGHLLARSLDRCNLRLLQLLGRRHADVPAISAGSG